MGKRAAKRRESGRVALSMRAKAESRTLEQAEEKATGRREKESKVHSLEPASGIGVGPGRRDLAFGDLTQEMIDYNSRLFARRRRTMHRLGRADSGDDAHFKNEWNAPRHEPDSGLGAGSDGKGAVYGVEGQESHIHEAKQAVLEKFGSEYGSMCAASAKLKKLKSVDACTRSRTQIFEGFRKTLRTFG